jgi:hypothetical protein
VHQFSYTYSNTDWQTPYLMVQHSTKLTQSCTVEKAVIELKIKQNCTADLVHDGHAITQVLDGLPGNGLLVYSPGNLADIGASLKALGGTVSVVFVPSTYHYLDALAFQHAYPQATYVAPHAVSLIPEMRMLRIDHYLDAPKSTPKGHFQPLPLGELLDKLGEGIDVYQNPDQSRELVVHSHSASVVLTCDILYAASPTSSPPLPDPNTNPISSIFHKAFTLPSIAPPFNDYRTWLAIPMAELHHWNVTAINPKWERRYDVTWFNQYQVSLNNDPTRRVVDPQDLLCFYRGLMVLDVHGFTTGHVGYVSQANASILLDMESAWLMKHAAASKCT